MATTVVSDVDIQRDVEAEIDWEPSIRNRAEISVAVEDGIVTLKGPIHSYPGKLAAARGILRLQGVRAVVNGIEVRLPGSSQRSDEDIARAASNTLDRTSDIPRNQIKVGVDKGWITLNGTVDCYYEKITAEEAVQYLNGVEGLINLIEVRPSAGKAVVKGTIEKALGRNAALEAQRIRLETAGSKVILRGTVRSLRQKKEAERVAWRARGVTEVVNEVEVLP